MREEIIQDCIENDQISLAAATAPNPDGTSQTPFLKAKTHPIDLRIQRLNCCAFDVSLCYRLHT